jgi:glutamate/aspartate transport system substrate-binding protein
MSDVFLCYRRNDNPQTAWHLAYILNSEGYRTFLDTHILGGDLWEERLQNEIAACTVFICLIGENWLEKDPGGSPRIYQETDNVRKEIELAISRGKRILPILVGDASFPKPDDLPDSLRIIASIEFITLRFIPPDFYFDAAKVTKRVKELIGEQRGRARRALQNPYRLLRRKLVTALLSAVMSSVATIFLMLYLRPCEGPFCGADRYDEIMKRGEDGKPRRVVVGYRKYSIPFSYMLSDGSISGFMQEVCEDLIETVFFDFSIEKREVISDEKMSPGKGRLSAIEGGLIDIECGSTSITDGRKERVDFLETHVYSQTRFLSPRSLQIYDLEGEINFAGKNVNYVIGTTNQEVTKTSGTALDDFGVLLENIRSGKVDVAFTDDLLLAGFAASLRKSNHIISRAGYGELEQYGIMLPKNSPKLRERLQAAWGQLSRQGKVCELYRKHFASPAIAPHIGRVYEVRSKERDDDLQFTCVGKKPITGR